mmetsp:Transcript_13658/g.39391  ORF Transcript_13658/g.39391 Transcript_13658/m.39391 type:complete len:239 (-) Transcript_13658:730-1446(-)
MAGRGGRHVEGVVGDARGGGGGGAIVVVALLGQIGQQVGVDRTHQLKLKLADVGVSGVALPLGLRAPAEGTLPVGHQLPIGHRQSQIGQRVARRYHALERAPMCVVWCLAAVVHHHGRHPPLSTHGHPHMPTTATLSLPLDQAADDAAHDGRRQTPRERVVILRLLACVTVAVQQTIGQHIRGEERCIHSSRTRVGFDAEVAVPLVLSLSVRHLHVEGSRPCPAVAPHLHRPGGGRGW